MYILHRAIKLNKIIITVMSALVPLLALTQSSDKWMKMTIAFVWMRFGDCVLV